MLNSVRYAGLCSRLPSTGCAHPLTAPTIMVECGPRRMSVRMSTTYETDMFEPLAIGNWTVNAEVNDESKTKKAIDTEAERSARGNSTTRVPSPATMTEMM